MPTVADHTPFATLLPASGWEMQPELFQRETERNEGFGRSIDWPGWSSQITDEVPPVGIVSHLTYMLEGTCTVTPGSGSVTATDAWPHGLVRNYLLRLNSQAVPWNVRGQDLDVLAKARYRSITNDDEAKATSSGENTLRVFFDIPLSLDPALAPGTGGLFAQSQNSQLLSEITTGAESDVFTLTGDGAVSIDATFRRFSTWYSIPVGKTSDGGTGMILPDLTILHGALSQEAVVSQTGELHVEINRVQGTVARLWARIKNGTDSLDPVSDLDELRFGYASNQRPRVYKPEHLSMLNQRWYRGKLPYDAIAIDQVAENLVRDAIDVENLSNPQLTMTVDSGVSLDSEARATVVYEMLAPLA